MSDEAGICQRCERIRLLTHCCMAHMKEMCHECYRRTHFVEVCHPECTRCARDGLAPVLSGYRRATSGATMTVDFDDPDAPAVPEWIAWARAQRSEGVDPDAADGPCEDHPPCQPAQEQQ